MVPHFKHRLGFLDGTSGKEPACQYRRHKRCIFDPWAGKIPWRRAWQPTSVFLPAKLPWTEEPGVLQSIVLQSRTELKRLSTHALSDDKSICLQCGRSHGQRSLAGCRPWGCKESDMTERLHFHRGNSHLRDWRISERAEYRVQELTLIMVLNCKHHISCLRSFQITFYTNHFWKYQLGACVIWLKVTSKILLYVWPSDQDFCDRQSLGTCFDTHGRANLKVYGGNTSRAPVDQWRMGGLLGWFPLDSFLRS